uniref:centromere protein L isoform X2 n=1 Tax=Phalacrocorax carbo TaxID=9209 RepID=UPI00311A628A
MESADGAVWTLPSTRRLSRGPLFGRAHGRLGLSPSSRLFQPAPRSLENIDPQRTAFLLRKRWTLYSVTPLYGFSSARLRDYARMLSAFIAAEKQKGLAVEVGVELDIKVAVSSLPDLKGSDQDQAAILVQPLDISYAIHPEDAKALWDTVQKTPGEITQEEVDIFMDCLYSHFHRHFKIHLSATKLVKVSTAIASAHCDGIIKFLQSQYLTGVLMLLTELAISQIQ